MKYNEQNKPIQCFQTQSTWYKGTGTVQVRGVLWHSTGANNPYISRYVQPSDNAPDKEKMLAILGVNRNKNDWNHIYREAGVHAWIGKLTTGEVTTVQAGPWDKKAWGCASGSKGSCNNGWIQFEICEDSLNDKAYFDKIYKEACELTAYLCKLYNLDPMGTVIYNGVKVPVILCHQDSYKLGLGSNHGDIYHWFNRYHKTMDNVRQDVKALLDEKPAKDKEEIEVVYNKVSELPYGKDTIIKLIDNGIIGGTGTGKKDENGRPADLALTYDQLRTLVITDRAHEKGVW